MRCMLSWCSMQNVRGCGLVHNQIPSRASHKLCSLKQRLSLRDQKREIGTERRPMWDFHFFCIQKESLSCHALTLQAAVSLWCAIAAPRSLWQSMEGKRHVALRHCSALRSILQSCCCWGPRIHAAKILNDVHPRSMHRQSGACPIRQSNGWISPQLLSCSAAQLLSCSAAQLPQPRWWTGYQDNNFTNLTLEHFRFTGEHVWTPLLVDNKILQLTWRRGCWKKCVVIW